MPAAALHLSVLASHDGVAGYVLRAPDGRVLVEVEETTVEAAERLLEALTRSGAVVRAEWNYDACCSREDRCRAWREQDAYDAAEARS